MRAEAARAAAFGRRPLGAVTREQLEADFRRVGLSESDSRRAAVQLEAGRWPFDLVARQRVIFTETGSRIDEEVLAEVLQEHARATGSEVGS